MVQLIMNASLLSVGLFGFPTFIAHLIRTFMINDLWVKRFLAFSLGSSTLLVSAALLIATVKWAGPVQAEEWDPSASQRPWDDALRGAVGLGIQDNHAYFVIWSQPNQFYKVDLSKARNWYED